MKIFVIVCCLLSFCMYSQKKPPNLGRININELTLNVYQKDTTANALVLEESGYVFVDKENNYKFRRDVYRRIKIFNNTGYDKATITLNTYKNESIKNIKAITYNLDTSNKIEKIYFSNDKVYKKQLSEDWHEVTFTLPKIQNGCVIEYRYSVISPYSKIDDWKFQSDIPKLKSDFSTTIPRNWKYNIRTRSDRKFDRKNTYVKKNCIEIPGAEAGDCFKVTYGLDNIPAFKSEDYMLAKKNYMYRLMFELISYTNIRGLTTKYTKTWKHTDKTLRKRFFDNQVTKTRFLKNKFPDSIKKIVDDLKRAKTLYKHLQNKLFWNQKYWSKERLKIREIYEQNSGSADAINLLLYNALNALNIKSYLVVLSTRKNGKVTKLHPSISDFNYAIVKATINNETYFLDATDKFLSFGEVPFMCLNGEGRVLDFDNGSYWEDITSKDSSTLRYNIDFRFNEEFDELHASIKSREKGYYAIKKEKKYLPFLMKNI